MSTTESGEYPVPADQLNRFLDMGRESSTLTVILHARIAERMGLSGSDHKAMELVRDADGPLTAGRIAQLTGLSTGAVTGVIDRLERAGFVRRVRDDRDRRKVLVEFQPIDEQQFASLFDSLVDTTVTVLQKFAPHEREIIERYQNEILTALRADAFGT